MIKLKSSGGCSPSACHRGQWWRHGRASRHHTRGGMAG